MRPSSSPSDPPAGDAGGRLLDPLFTTDAVAEAVSGRAWVAAMLEVEAALARVQAKLGLVPPEAAEAIASASRPERFDPAALSRAAASTGSLAIPLVRALREAVPGDAARYVHQAATSQDIIDTAAMLVARRALGPILADLDHLAERCAELAATHRSTPMAGRTLLQQAVPITFGLKAAGWLVGLDEARARLAVVRDTRLAVQLGGAAGTLAGNRRHGVALGEAVLDGLADELGLGRPVLPWHTVRVRLGELAGALGVVAGVLGKVATDLVLLAQTEVAEVAEPAGEGRGGSSAMPHKRNPVGAVLAAACARRAPGLVASLLSSMVQEHERAAGAWHAEWEPLVDLVRVVGGAAGRLREALDGLQVDPARMRANLALTGGLLMAEQVTARLAGALGWQAARELVEAACRGAVADRRPLREVLLDDERVRAHLSPDQLDAALDPAASLGEAGILVDRALAAHRSLGTAHA